MAQELLTYGGLAQRLNISVAAAKGLAKGLHLTRYPAPDGKTLLLVDLSRLRATDLAADDDDEPMRRGRRRTPEDIDNDAPDFDVEPRRQRRPGPRRAARAQMVASLHERIEHIQRQLERAETEAGEQAFAGPDDDVLNELFQIAYDARQTAEQAREELAAYRSRRWWKRASA
jgi:hypothetical protein